jgi:iron complex transport system substrate-binding protein
VRSRREFLLGVTALAAASASPRAQPVRAVTDDVGRRAEVPVKVARVYAAGPPASILVFALAPEKLLGWTSPFRPEERPFVPVEYADLPALGRLTGRGNTANVEVVLAARPDLIVDYGSIRPTLASLADRVQAQTGIPYLLLDGAFDRMPHSLRKLGEILGEAERGESWARFAEGILDDIAVRVKRVLLARRPRVYYGRGPRGLDTGLAGSINMESIERIGATNVAAALGQGGLVRVSVEQVLAWNPDAIVTIDRNFYASVWHDPLWQGLAAVRSGRVFLSPNVPFGWIDFPPSVNRLLGLRWLARTLYPDVFPEDLRPFVREFYTRAYHQTPTPAQLDALVRTAEPRRG